MADAGAAVTPVTRWELPPELLASTDALTARVRAMFRGTSPYLSRAMTEDHILDIVRDDVPRLPARPAGMNDACYGIWLRRWYREHAVPQGIERRDDQAGIPARNLLRCLTEAGAFEPYKGRMKLTDDDGTRVASLLRIEEEFLPFPPEWQEWELDVRTVVRQDKEVREGRARFPKWGFTATFAFDPNEFSAERLRRLLEVAGYRVGLGSFRTDPRRDRIRAVFGRFKIVGWEVLADGATAKAA